MVDVELEPDFGPAPDTTQQRRAQIVAGLAERGVILARWPAGAWHDLKICLDEGSVTGIAPAGSATWLGIMVGTPVTGAARGERLVGDAALTYDFPSGGDGSGPSLDAAFGGIENIDRGTAHTVETVLFENVAVDPDGTFARGQSGARIQGGFYGPGHAEAAGVFEQSDIVGAFGARRQ